MSMTAGGKRLVSSTVSSSRRLASWKGTNLAAASEACPAADLDFAALLPQAENLLG